MGNEKELQADVSNSLDTLSDTDERELAAIGKKSVLRVRHIFSPLTTQLPTNRR